jgi:hypothetical protein
MSSTSVAMNIMRSLPLIVVAVAVLVLLHIAKVPAEGLWLQSFLNSLHVFVFAVVVLLLFAATKAIPNLSITRRATITLIATFALGIVSEAAQISGPRDASLEDLFSNWLGASGTLLVAIAFLPKTLANNKSRLSVSLAGLAILAFALFPLLKVSAAYAEQYIQKPVLVSFDSLLPRTFVRPQHSTLTIVKLPSGNEVVGRVSLTDGAWPGLIIHDIWPDWSPYSELVVDLHLDAEAPLEIHFRVHDKQHQVGEQPYNDRFNLTRELQPGRQTLRIPLEQIRIAPRDREMDLSQIAGMVLFCSTGQAGRDFQLVEIRLE